MKAEKTPEKLKDLLPVNAHFYVSIFGALNRVVDACFGWELQSDFEE